MERLKAAELRDYFDDECVDAALLRSVDAAEVEEGSLIVYPIALPDRLELLVSSPAGMTRKSISIPASELESAARRLRGELQTRPMRGYEGGAQQLYDWLIRPIEPEITARRARTLIFVTGGALRGVPMAALHDGERFLIERFEVGMTPGLDLTDPKPINRDAPLAIIAGLSESTGDLAALPYVEQEIESIADVFPSKVLLNEEFVPANIRQELSSKPYSVLHIASHAEFPTEGAPFVQSFDGRLSVEDLTSYVGLFKRREQPLELLMLSACETAAGDDDAALGLSGIVVKAGARSAIGTLWRVNDETAARFSSRFYRELGEPGRSRATAVRRAQLDLLRDPSFNHPAYWAPFLLIGTWL